MGQTVLAMYQAKVLVNTNFRLERQTYSVSPAGPDTRTGVGKRSTFQKYTL